MSSTTPQALSSHRSSSDPSPDLPSLLQSFFDCCNAGSYNRAGTYLSPTVLGLHQGLITGVSPHSVLLDIVANRDGIAEPFVPYAVVKEVKEVKTSALIGSYTENVRGLSVEFAFVGPGGDEGKTAGRRGKGRYWFAKETLGGKRDIRYDDEWQWKIILLDLDDLGFE